MPALVAAIAEAFSERSIGAPERFSASIDDDRRLLLMPAWGERSDLGVKLVSIDARRRPSIQSIFIVMDQEIGLPRAILDGAALTRRRTAAASVLAASKLARRSGSLLVLGTGALVEPLIEAYSSMFDLQSIAIWGRDLKKAQLLASQRRAAGYPAVAAQRLDEQLRKFDIVSAATMATSPLIAGARLAPGTHVDLIGAYTPEMCEADGDTFARASIFVDTLPGARSEAGDLIQAIEAGAVRWGDVCGDLAMLCAGDLKLRPSKDLTLFKSVGTAVEDLAAARLVLEGHAA
jgi:ornithine cyclodeaminase